jgi:hypothetical protein
MFPLGRNSDRGVATLLALLFLAAFVWVPVVAVVAAICVLVFSVGNGAWPIMAGASYVIAVFLTWLLFRD